MQTPKPHYIYFLLLCLSFPIGAQDTQYIPQRKNEISATMVSLRNNYFGDHYGSGFYMTLMSGISYRRHHGPHAFRLGMEFKDSASGSIGDVQGYQRYREGKFNLGYQLQLSAKRLKPFAAMDLIYFVGKEDAAYQGGYAGFYSKVDQVRQGIGFSPALGIQYQLINSLSISMETNYEFIWINEKGTILRGESFYSTNKITIPVDKNQYNYHWNPINKFSLNFGF